MAKQSSSDWFGKLDRWKDYLEDDKGQVLLVLGIIVLFVVFGSIFKDD
ncbi:hypothetical protein GTO89_14235 [Heliobacterium gestii]|uniref:Uncharacterized protein n=1 Tax=Heliomicrobium gestii TaxID=2699 RepID=A0A845LLD4_HELGE|nr:hypothetical protein [Heliomicrobium gestii]MBM7867800.1 hypothetical protein [Heliomicrobium gestii]MZP44193.1 hypothetical protein [Heliomicrobium gestii]